MEASFHPPLSYVILIREAPWEALLVFLAFLREEGVFEWTKWKGMQGKGVGAGWGCWGKGRQDQEKLRLGQIGSFLLS